MVTVLRAEESRLANCQHGLARTLLSNMVVGVDTGFTRTLNVRFITTGQGRGRGGAGWCARLCLLQTLLLLLMLRHRSTAALAGRAAFDDGCRRSCCLLPPPPPACPNAQMVGVGYKAAVNGSNLTLNLGYSHPIEMPVPQGLSVSAAGDGCYTVGQLCQCAAVLVQMWWLACPGSCVQISWQLGGAF